jgi:hypothetical protein
MRWMLRVVLLGVIFYLPVQAITSWSLVPVGGWKSFWAHWLEMWKNA